MVAADQQKAAAPAVPEQRTLDRRLRAQRLRLVRFYAVGLAVSAPLLCAASCAFAFRDAHHSWLVSIITAHAGVLGFAGAIAFWLCRRSHLRAGTYAIVLPLIVVATINLALVANAEGAAVITYCIAISVATLGLEGREWLCVAVLLGICAVAGALLHSSMALIEPVRLPYYLAAGSILVATTLGLAYPTALFWLFNSNLTASRQEAWDLARAATEANRLKTERTEELELRTKQLEEKNRELGDFLYVVSHDLRAPLINMEGFSQALRESVAVLDRVLDGSCTSTGDQAGEAAGPDWPELKEELNESLDFILRSIAKMDFLVRGLLELSRIDSRPDHVQPVDLNRTVQDILDASHYHISQRKIAVTVDPLPTVVGDPVRLSQVFGNLIDNAIKYMRPEGDARIHVACQNGDDAYRFLVRDTGVGIHAEDHARVFRLFTRVNGHGVPGDGVGLTAVKKIVEKHGGRIWVESEVGRGSTFWFTVPHPSGEKRTDENALSGTD